MRTLTQGGEITGPVASFGHVADYSVLVTITKQLLTKGDLYQVKGDHPPHHNVTRGNRISVCLASSVHLTDSEVKCKYKIPVHSNSPYKIRDTPNDYEN